MPAQAHPAATAVPAGHLAVRQAAVQVGVVEVVVPVAVAKVAVTKVAITVVTITKATITTVAVTKVTITKATITKVTITTATITKVTITTVTITKVTITKVTIAEVTITQIAVREITIPVEHATVSTCDVLLPAARVDTGHTRCTRRTDAPIVVDPLVIRLGVVAVELGLLGFVEMVVGVDLGSVLDELLRVGHVDAVGGDVRVVQRHEGLPGAEPSRRHRRPRGLPGAVVEVDLRDAAELLAVLSVDGGVVEVTQLVGLVLIHSAVIHVRLLLVGSTRRRSAVERTDRVAQRHPGTARRPRKSEQIRINVANLPTLAPVPNCREDKRLPVGNLGSPGVATTRRPRPQVARSGGPHRSTPPRTAQG